MKKHSFVIIAATLAAFASACTQKSEQGQPAGDTGTAEQAPADTIQSASPPAAAEATPPAQGGGIQGEMDESSQPGQIPESAEQGGTATGQETESDAQGSGIGTSE